MSADAHAAIRALVAQIEPADELEAEHRAEALAWIDSTRDLFRRVSSPVDPRMHLVSYFLLVDPDGPVLLGDHLKSGLWLPSGGHVEPGEHPVETVRRECVEELAVEAVFARGGEQPLFVTVTETVNSSDPHRDVSLWFLLESSRDEPLTPDPGEYRSVRWWAPEEVATADPALFDPHLPRLLSKLGKISEKRDEIAFGDLF